MLRISLHIYFVLVCPSLEYALVVWDPYQNWKNWTVRKTKSRVLNNFSLHSSVTAMLQHLQWPTWCIRISRLATNPFQNNSPRLPIPPYFTPMERSTRLYHPRHFILPHTHTKTALYLKTLRDWNNWPSNLNGLDNIDTAWFECLYLNCNFT